MEIHSSHNRLCPCARSRAPLVLPACTGSSCTEYTLAIARGSHSFVLLVDDLEHSLVWLLLRVLLNSELRSYSNDLMPMPVARRPVGAGSCCNRISPNHEECRTSAEASRVCYVWRLVEFRLSLQPSRVKMALREVVFLNQLMPRGTK